MPVGIMLVLLPFIHPETLLGYLIIRLVATFKRPTPVCVHISYTYQETNINSRHQKQQWQPVKYCSFIAIVN